jgi:hypothetical protein
VVLMRATYCTNPIETKHTFVVPAAIVYDVVDWCEEHFGERMGARGRVNWRAMRADTASDAAFIIHDDDHAMQFRLRWC